MGDACRAPGLSCSFGDSARPSCRDRIQCSGGRWISLKAGGCSDDSSCPNAEPSSGDACDGLDQECDYPSKGSFCRCECTDSLCPQQRWVCSDAPPSGCVATLPNEGTDCPTEGQRCTYGSCRLGDAVTTTCTEGLWRWQATTCG